MLQASPVRDSDILEQLAIGSNIITIFKVPQRISLCSRKKNHYPGAGERAHKLGLRTALTIDPNLSPVMSGGLYKSPTSLAPGDLMLSSGIYTHTQMNTKINR